MQDEPRPDELVKAVADFLRNDIAPQIAGHAAFKLRVALPGSLGPELTAKVQSLRSLPGEESLGKEDVGASVALPGGPGWPENEVVVRLLRVGLRREDLRHRGRIVPARVRVPGSPSSRRGRSRARRRPPARRRARSSPPSARTGSNGGRRPRSR